jgi:putative chitinase
MGIGPASGAKVQLEETAMIIATASAGTPALPHAVPPCVANGKFAAALPRLWPHGNSVVKGLLEEMIASAPIAFPKWSISSDIVVAHVMGEFGEESGCGREMQVDLNYSAAGLLHTFPTHFNYEQVIALQHQPRRIADQAYNGRMGNRLGTDDGWDRRGARALTTDGPRRVHRLRQENRHRCRQSS